MANTIGTAPVSCNTFGLDAFGLREGGDNFDVRAVIATFRMRKPSEKSRSVCLTARLTFRTNPDSFFREPSTILHRVHYGMWLGEDYNFVSLNLTDTKEVILTVSADGKCVAVQDNRYSVSKRDEATFFEFPEALESYLVEVALLDEEFGHLVSFNYEIRTKPLSVHEAISVLPEGFSRLDSN